MAVPFILLGGAALAGITGAVKSVSAHTKGCIFSEPAKLLNFLTTDGSKDTGF